ncbi:MAG: Phage virion morphogenesis family protein [Syntrophaceae bacterium PtaB.Bin095]|jgi:phage virion morphogenesis protein|nr:MAG: Phage virion morphogenesis family protein [Syntrophaceae bacterium PtaB.Bin095]
MPDITIRIEDKPVMDALNRLARKMGDLSPALRAIGEDLVKSTEARFDSQGPAPDGKPWAALSPATLKRKQHSKILTELGHLRGSIRSQLFGTHGVAVGTNKVYGAIHQLGGPAGRGRKIRIPARPYLGISSEDSERIAGIVTRYLEGTV